MLFAYFLSQCSIDIEQKTLYLCNSVHVGLHILSVSCKFELVSLPTLAQNGKDGILTSFELWEGEGYGGQG